MTQATKARDEAMALAAAHADQLWLKAARRSLLGFARSGRAFTSVDVLEYLEQRGIRCREPRALGPLMMEAKRAGLIWPTREFIQSTRRKNHARPVRVWKPL